MTHLPLLAHLSIRLSFILEHRIPSEGSRTTCRHDLSFSLSLEERDFFAWPATVGKGADGIACFVRVGEEEIVEARVTQ